MKKIWIVMVIVLSIMILSMTYYIFFIEETDNEKRFIVFFPPDDLHSQYNGYTNHSEYSEIIYNFNKSNIVSINFFLSWYDDNTYGGFPPEESYEYYDMFQMNITGPNGTFYSYRNKEYIEIVYFNQERPQFQYIKANSKEEAYERFIDYTGVGNWTINISIEASGGSIFEPDNGNDWQLDIRTEYYEINVEEL